MIRNETNPSGGKVLARKVSSHSVDAHFWKKYKENLVNLLYICGKTCLPSGRPVFKVWLKACLVVRPWLKPGYPPGLGCSKPG